MALGVEVLGLALVWALACVLSGSVLGAMADGGRQPQRQAEDYKETKGKRPGLGWRCKQWCTMPLR